MKNITPKLIPHSIRYQHGFTLIELMISLVLGLLISAAVMQVFLTSQRVDRIQTAASEIQDKAVFGLQAIESQVRLANLGNDGVAINDTTAMGGIVLTAGNYDGGTGESGSNGNNEEEKTQEEKEKEEREEKEADKKDNEADKKNREAEEKENKGQTKEAAEKRREADAKRAEATKKRAEAAKKREEAAQIGNRNAYNFRRVPTSEFQQASFKIPVFQKLGFQRVGFQKVASSIVPKAYNVMVKDGLSTGYLTRSDSMTSEGGNNKWNSSLSNTNQLSDQLTIQYTNVTGRELFDCEGEKIEPNAHVITRYFVADGTGTGSKARKNLNLRCDAGRITSDGKLKDFMDSGETIIENIDQFNIRLGVQSSSVDDDPLNYQYADMTVAKYMALTSEKPSIINIRIAILARSTANSPEASANKFVIFGKEQSLKEQDDAPKYLRRVYESNILLRNARIMRVINTTVV